MDLFEGRFEASYIPTDYKHCGSVGGVTVISFVWSWGVGWLLAFQRYTPNSSTMTTFRVGTK